MQSGQRGEMLTSQEYDFPRDIDLNQVGFTRSHADCRTTREIVLNVISTIQLHSGIIICEEMHPDETEQQNKQSHQLHAA